VLEFNPFTLSIGMNLFRRESISKESDFGRMFGWWVNIDGKCVASLEYLSWDINSQYWHIYKVTELSHEFSNIGFEPDRWCDLSVTLQSKFATSFEKQGVLMSPRGENIIALRDLYVPGKFLVKAKRDK